VPQLLRHVLEEFATLPFPPDSCTAEILSDRSAACAFINHGKGDMEQNSSRSLLVNNKSERIECSTSTFI
jgi:hypothetical protein